MLAASTPISIGAAGGAKKPSEMMAFFIRFPHPSIRPMDYSGCGKKVEENWFLNNH